MTQPGETTIAKRYSKSHRHHDEKHSEMKHRHSIGMDMTGSDFSAASVGDRFGHIDLNRTKSKIYPLADVMSTSNGWYAGLQAWNEFWAVFFLNFMMIIGYAFAGGVPLVGSVIAGMVVGMVSYFFSYWGGYYGNSGALVLDVAMGRLAWWYGMIIGAMHIGAWFFGAFFAWIVADSRYPFAVLGITGAGVSQFEAFLVEMIGTFFLMAMIYYTKRDDKAPAVTSIMKGFTVFGLQALGNPISGGSYEIMRWLSINVMTSASVWNDAWVYIVPYFICVIILGIYDKGMEYVAAKIDAREEQLKTGSEQGYEAA